MCLVYLYLYSGLTDQTKYEFSSKNSKKFYFKDERQVSLHYTTHHYTKPDHILEV